MYCVVGRGGGSGAGLYGDCGRGVPRPWVGLAGGSGCLWGWMMGRSDMGMFTRVGMGSCLGAASVVAAAAGGRGAWVVVGGGSWFGLGFGLGRCFFGWRRCACGVLCVRLGTGFGFGLGLGLGSGFRFRRTSVRGCEGACAASGLLSMRCRGACVACVGVGGSVRAAAALALAVALWMRAAGRGGSEDELEEVDEAEDEKEGVDAGWAVMRAVVGLSAAASAAATAGRMQGMSSGCRLGAGGCLGLVVT